MLIILWQPGGSKHRKIHPSCYSDSVWLELLFFFHPSLLFEFMSCYFFSFRHMYYWQFQTYLKYHEKLTCSWWATWAITIWFYMSQNSLLGWSLTEIQNKIPVVNGIMLFCRYIGLPFRSYYMIIFCDDSRVQKNLVWLFWTRKITRHYSSTTSHLRISTESKKVF
jgi:hypothetical protein